jgi:hypothetical protein
MQSTTLRVFVVTVIVAAAAALVALPSSELLERPTLLALLVALSALAGAYPVRVPLSRYEITATHPFILLALASLSPMAAVVVALAGVLGAAIGRPGRWPAAMRLCFNLGAVALSTAAAAAVFLAMGGGSALDLVALLPPLACATVAFFAANTGLTTAAIALEKRQALFRTWAKSFLWTVVSYFSGLTVAVAMLSVRQAPLLWLLAIGLPACLLLVLFYRFRAENLRLSGVE